MRTVILAAALVLFVTSAHAQHESDALVLARICAHEAGWSAHESGDCAAIATVLLRLAEDRGWTFRAAAYAYSGRALRGETSRRYYAELDEHGTQPASWPGHRWVTRGDIVVAEPGPSWSRFRPRWLALLDHARAVLAGEVVDACADPPDDWGGRVDRRRAARLGLVEVDCGETHNDFYRRPSRMDDVDPD